MESGANEQYLPEIVNDILKLCHLIPLWTAVMVPHFGYGAETASSASVESSFNDIKHRMCQNLKLPARIDDFLFTHIKHLCGTMKLAAASALSAMSSAKNVRFAPVDEDICGRRKEKETVHSVDIHELGQTETDKAKDLTLVPTCSADAVVQQQAISDEDKSEDDLTGILLKPSTKQNEGRVLKTVRFALEDGCIKHKELNQDKCINVLERSSALSKQENATEMGEKSETTVLENWRGLAKKHVNKRRRKSYLERSPEMLSTDFQSPNKSIPIGLLKNGSCSGLRPIQMGQGKVIVTNTCAFDSLVQLACVGYCDSQNYKAAIDQHAETSAMADMVTKMMKTGPNAKLYRLRAEALRRIITDEKKLACGLVSLDAALPIAEMIRRVWEGMATAEEFQQCTSDLCPRKNVKFPITVTTVGNPSESLDNIQEKVNEDLTAKRSFICRSALENVENWTKADDNFGRDESSKYPLCNGIRTIQKITSPYHIFVEVIGKNEANVVQLLAKPENLPRILTVSGTKYFLRGATSYTGEQNSRSVGHYMAYCLRQNGEWEVYDDLVQKVCFANPRKARIFHALFYTV